MKLRIKSALAPPPEVTGGVHCLAMRGCGERGVRVVKRRLEGAAPLGRPD